MEEGGLELETNIALWERGELLAKICDAFLTAAEEKLAAAEEEE
jgi:exodeoxyribonuclease VII small subunit